MLDPQDDGVDQFGNTKIHQLVVNENELNSMRLQLGEAPHHLFMLNKYGQTPLDITIQEGVDAATQEARYLAQKNQTMAKLEDDKEQFAKVKSMILIQRMVKYPRDCSLKFIKKPLRLDLRFEKSFTLAVKENKQDVLELFPRGSVKSVYVSMHQLLDYRQFKNNKTKMTTGAINDLLTTPLHIAAEHSNIEAVRCLIQNHNYDVNILIKEKNFLIDLLETAGYKDFSILNVLFSKKRPCINSGVKLPLN